MDGGFDELHVEPYDCNDERNEPRPDHVIYKEVFADLKRHITHVKALMRDPLQQSSYHNAITRGLLMELQTCAKESTEEEAQFAVAGDMNSGRSQCE